MEFTMMKKKHFPGNLFVLFLLESTHNKHPLAAGGDRCQQTFHSHSQKNYLGNYPTPSGFYVLVSADNKIIRIKCTGSFLLLKYLQLHFFLIL